MAANQIEIMLRARDEASRVMNQMSSRSVTAFQKMGEGVGKLLSRFKLLIAAGITAAGYAFVRLVKDSIRYGIQMDKLRKETGLSTEELVRLRYAMEQEHGSAAVLEKGLMNLTVRIGYAGDGLATYTRYFDALGISYKKADGTLRNTYDVFMDIVDVTSKGELTTEKMAAVMQLFGVRAAKDLIPFLKLGRNEIKRLGEEGFKLIGITQEDTDAMKRFDDELFKVKTGIRGLGIHIALELLPTLENLASWMADNIPEMRKAFDWVPDTVATIGKAGVSIGIYINMVTISIGKLLLAQQKAQRFIYGFGTVTERGREKLQKMDDEILTSEGAIKELEKKLETGHKLLAQFSKGYVDSAKVMEKHDKALEEKGKKTRDLGDEEKRNLDITEKMTEQLIGAFPFMPPAMGMRAPAIRRELPAGGEGGTPISLHFNVTNREQIYSRLEREFDRLGV